jgi:U3 small nucleolar ribonucleoprotein protein IMP4
MPSTTDATSSANLRRQQRLRREYLYRKSLEGQEKVTYEQKRLLREALASGKKQSLPTELRASYDKLQPIIQAEDTKTSQLRSNIDDEYGDTVGLMPPQVCITTSRDPSSRLKQFVKEMKLIIPNTTRINRGNTRIDELISSCTQQEFTDVVIVQETRGEPDGLVVCHLPFGPTAYFTLNNAVLRHDLDPPAAPMSEVYPHLIFHNFHTKTGLRVTTILKCLFPVPNNPNSQRIITFANENDSISFRHHMYNKVSHDNVQLYEIGPRFEMKLYQVKLGTIDQKEADNEYILRPYQNTASKRQVL